MAESAMVGARVPQEWQQQISEIATASGRREAEVVREAIAQYLGRTDPAAVKGTISDLQDRVTNLERQLATLGQLVGCP
jgi:RHH-type rel operon transcriptional repressor/antitoxin RelB